MRVGRQLPRARLSFSDGATDQLRGMGTLVVSLQPAFQLRERAGQFLSEAPEGIGVVGVSGGVAWYAIDEVMCFHGSAYLTGHLHFGQKKESDFSRAVSQRVSLLENPRRWP